MNIYCYVIKYYSCGMVYIKKGYAIAEDFDEARHKIKNHYITKEIASLEITEKDVLEIE